ncbi:glycerophosphodiester phosphodiesterase [Arcanobacterium hippocoleae]|uniref:Glycerophosphoryl diester phosphodiesterase n=1 Tax=Arcanobacterium hippocoleae TaxID=149017 RepID=A0ABU1T3K1_9ACTO|nr:glycerophosphodiester phosphodiesterase [Arcanobacterium hippocoleae]MDR6939967.1 glycerophosphoryl diester phosphodiesterase [Arcanobacterium hippocoleae]
MKYQQRKPSERIWKIGEKPIVLAHRAGGNEAPENSFAAFMKMEQLGFSYIETDAHATKDGVVILFHDPVLDRTTNGHGMVSNYTWEELTDVHDESGNSPVRLDEVLARFPDLILNIDAKNFKVVRPLARVIREKNALRRVSLSSFNETRLKMLRRMLPGVVTSLGQGAMALLLLQSKLPRRLQKFVDRLVPGVAQGAQAIQVPCVFAKINIVTPQLIDLCHRRGQAVHVWTVNEADEMLRLLKMGVDAIITDEPSLARRVINFYWDGAY